MSSSAAKVVRAIRATVRGDWSGINDRELLRRFVEESDQDAFAALVRRHGELVLGACRRALPRTQDAEDACQATFLVLVKKAATQRWQTSVAGWLCATARKVAANARQAAQRRIRREGRAAVPEAVEPMDQVTGRELLTALDEELDRLPPRYREPLVLCYLEGLTRDEVASRLGVPTSTVKTQLERGRKKLGDALTRRGCGLGAGLLALAVTPTARASSPRLVEAVLAAVSGAPPAAVAALAKGVSVNTMVHKLMPLVLAVVAAAVLGVVTAAVQAPAVSEPADKARAAAALGTAKPQAAANTAKPQAAADSAKPRAAADSAKPQAAADKDAIAYGGRVLGPDGKPVPGARLHMTTAAYGYADWPAPSAEYATTGPDGSFTFTVSKAKSGDRWSVVAVTAANYGPDWVEIPAGGKKDDLTLRLVPDGPITGQIVDLEGKPVRGVTLRVLQINAAPREDLGPWLEAVKGKKGRSLELEQEYLTRYTIALSPKVTTDAEGRFRLAGIGRNRLVRARLDGPTIASAYVQILTRPGETIAVTEHEGKPEYRDPRTVTTYYGANFRHVAAPTKPIIGRVRDKDTKKPHAGVTIQSYARAINPNYFRSIDIVRTTTDAQGRYRLTGMPKGEGFWIMAVPESEQPYVVTKKEVHDSPGLDPVTVDFELKRGIWIEGKITDKATGKPLHGSVEYFSMYTNPHLRDYPGFGGTPFNFVSGKEDGSYRVIGLPGPGLIGVYYRKEHNLRANEREDEFGTKKESLNTAPFAITIPGNYSALARIDPPKGVDSVRRDITIDFGWTFKGTVLGPDGKPLSGARTPRSGWHYEEMKTAEFTVRGFNPRRPRDVLFQHLAKGLAGVAQPPKENGGSIVVRMQVGATVTGRLVDAAGRARAGIELTARFRTKESLYWSNYSPISVKTDGEGRFRIEALPPGYEFLLEADKGRLRFGGLHSGQTKDLGDMKPETRGE